MDKYVVLIKDVSTGTIIDCHVFDPRDYVVPGKCAHEFAEGYNEAYKGISAEPEYEAFVMIACPG